MTTYFPFGHIIVGIESTETRHPYFAAWNVSTSEKTDSAETRPQISELYY